MGKLAINGGSKTITTENESLFHWPIITNEDIQAVTEVLQAGTMSGNEISKVFEKNASRSRSCRRRNRISHQNG